MKYIAGIILVVILFTSNGCMTDTAIHAAKGHTELCVIYPVWEVTDGKSHPGYYALMLITVPFDIATSPIQAVGILGYMYLMTGHQ